MRFWTANQPAAPIDELCLYGFSLPYRRPLLGENERRGFLLRCRRGTHEGWGEISPWPGLHLENGDVLSRELPTRMSRDLDAWMPELICEAVLPHDSASNTAAAKLDAAKVWLQSFSPLVAWGIVSALLDLLAAEKGVPQAKLLNPQAPDAVKIAGLILEEQDFAAGDYAKYAAVKVKSRRAGTDALWSKIRENCPHIEIRADGNRMLSLEEAWQMCEAGQRMGVRFFEEPTPVESLYELMKRGAQIALDETLSSPHLEVDLLRAACVWVLKPSVLGPFRTFALLRGEKPVVMSSPFESAVGRRNLVQLQAAFSPTEAAGLGVAAYFARDLLPQPAFHPHASCEASLDLDLEALVEIGRWTRA